MKQILILLAVISFPVLSRGQVRGQEPRHPSIADQHGVYQYAPGLFDPSRFSMSHSFSVSYLTMGGQSVGVTKYTNSMQYRFSEPLSLLTDVSVLSSPFGSLSNLPGFNETKIYLERAQLKYEPSRDMKFSLEFRQYPIEDQFRYRHSGGRWTGRSLSGSSQDDRP